MKLFLAIAYMLVASSANAIDVNDFNPFVSKGRAMLEKPKVALTPPPGNGWFYDAALATYWKYTSPAQDQVLTYPELKLLPVRAATPSALWVVPNCPTGNCPQPGR